MENLCFVCRHHRAQHHPWLGRCKIKKCKCQGYVEHSKIMKIAKMLKKEKGFSRV